jgi:hypothetical protein
MEQQKQRACVALDASLHREIKALAALRGEPLATFVQRALTAALQSDAKQASTATRKR